MPCKTPTPLKKQLVTLLIAFVITAALFLNGTQALGQNQTTNTYSTVFPLAEDPISEGALWINGGSCSNSSVCVGLDWNNVQTTPGKAFGTGLSYSPPYSDSTAILTETWGPDQEACGIVFLDPKLVRNNAEYEVEIRLRTKIAPNEIVGYEFNYSMRSIGQYAGIVRWNGALNNFTGLSSIKSHKLPVLADGDQLCAFAVGTTLMLVHNGAVILTAGDSSYDDGTPGIGFYNHRGTLSDNPLYGFKSFTANDGAVLPPGAGGHGRP